MPAGVRLAGTRTRCLSTLRIRREGDGRQVRGSRRKGKMDFVVESATSGDAADITRLWSEAPDVAQEELIREASQSPEALVAVARNGHVVGACVGHIQTLPRCGRGKVGVLLRMCAENDAPEVLRRLNAYAVDWMRRQNAEVVRLNEPASEGQEALAEMGYRPFADVMALKLA